MTDILIVEDNKELGNLLCDLLRAENYTVSVAETGEKALSLYEKYGARLKSLWAVLYLAKWCNIVINSIFIVSGVCVDFVFRY